MSCEEMALLPVGKTPRFIEIELLAAETANFLFHNVVFNERKPLVPALQKVPAALQRIIRVKNWLTGPIFRGRQRFLRLTEARSCAGTWITRLRHALTLTDPGLGLKGNDLLLVLVVRLHQVVSTLCQCAGLLCLFLGLILR